MTEQHPITPPPELLEQWMQAHSTKYDLARQAAQWGADQELEACCKWLCTGYADTAEHLRAARRPKPPSLKEEALNALESLQQRTTDPNIIEPLRRALEALPDD
jgi:hypothetical protein